MRLSFRSEGPEPTKTQFKHVYLNIGLVCQNISILEYGLPEMPDEGSLALLNWLSLGLTTIRQNTMKDMFF